MQHLKTLMLPFMPTLQNHLRNQVRESRRALLTDLDWVKKAHDVKRRTQVVDPQTSTEIRNLVNTTTEVTSPSKIGGRTDQQAILVGGYLYQLGTVLHAA